jgi:hypothetical protein
LGAQVTVANGAGLSGNGSVGSVVNHGVVASGGADGTLSVAGNLTNSSDGVLALTVSSPTATPLAVGGTAALAAVRSTASRHSPAIPLTSLITAGGGVTGTFSAADLPQYAFLDSSLVYGADSVTLAVSRNGNSFADVAATGNQRAPPRHCPTTVRLARRCRTRSSTSAWPVRAMRSTASPGKSTPAPPAPCLKTRASFARRSTTACASHRAALRMIRVVPWHRATRN